MKKIITTISLAAFYVAYILYDRSHPAVTGVALSLAPETLSANAQNADAQATGSANTPATQTTAQKQLALAQPTVSAQSLSASAAQVPAAQQAQQANSQTSQAPVSQSPAPTPAPAVSAPTPIPTPAPVPTPTPAPVQQQPQGQYKDGQYTGPSVSALYGNVQVKAIITGGQLTDVQFLSYPQDRSTSLALSNMAMSTLTQEAVAAQSANVNIVSGATETSQAFMQSLASALSQAKA